MGIAKSALGVMTSGKTWSWGLSGLSAASAYSDSRDQGSSFLTSVAAGAKDFVLPELMGAKFFMAYSLAPALAGTVVTGYENINTAIRQNQRSDQTPFGNYTFRDSEALQQMRMSSLALAEQATGNNFTMRQQGVANARDSRYAMQETSFGNEARYIHR